MKNLKTLSISLLFASFLFGSCNKSETLNPEKESVLQNNITQKSQGNDLKNTTPQIIELKEISVIPKDAFYLTVVDPKKLSAYLLAKKSLVKTGLSTNSYMGETFDKEATEPFTPDMENFGSDNSSDNMRYAAIIHQTVYADGIYGTMGFNCVVTYTVTAEAHFVLLADGTYTRYLTSSSFTVPSVTYSGLGQSQGQIMTMVATKSGDNQFYSNTQGIVTFYGTTFSFALNTDGSWSIDLPWTPDGNAVVYSTFHVKIT